MNHYSQMIKMYLHITKSTQKRLKRIKKDKTYDEVISLLLYYNSIHQDNIEKIVRDYIISEKKNIG